MLLFNTLKNYLNQRHLASILLLFILGCSSDGIKRKSEKANLYTIEDSVILTDYKLEVLTKTKVMVIKDTSGAFLHLEALNDSDEYIRSNAASALYKMGHPRALEACLKTLNDGGTPLHVEYTPSVEWLIRIGSPALPALMDSLLSNDKPTRVRAEIAVFRIIRSLSGLQPRHETNESVPEYNESVKKFNQWRKTVGYDYESHEDSRKRAVDMLRDWYSTNVESSGH